MIALPLVFAAAVATSCGAPPAPATPAATSETISASVAPAATTAAPAGGATSAATPTPEEASLGQLDFTVTGSAECQRRFREGMLALHSFLYDQAHESFGLALTADPRCAMAAWGDAMAYDHAIWEERDLTKGRAALARVTGEDALTAKERAYISTARTLFANESVRDAHVAWLGAAAAMHEVYPDDDEVALQHALALLSVYGDDPAHVREQMEAGAIALSVFQRRPEHPGAAHYAIHSFDSSDHAILALPAARAYARIAPAGFHALHMPSHIFVQLGMWRDVVPSNEKAYATSVAWQKAHGQSPSKYDWHSYSWLLAAHLELGQYTTARKLLDDAKALLVAAKDDSGALRMSYASMVSDYVSQTDRWGDVETLVAPLFTPVLGEGTGEAGPVACAMHAPGGGGELRGPAVLWSRVSANGLRAEAAIRAHDEATAAKRVADMKAVRAQMAPWSKLQEPDFATRWLAADDVLLARAHAAAKPSAAAEKKAVDALERILRASATQSSSGPVWDRTRRETLGEILLASGKAKEALELFEKDLEAHPKRAIALLDAARAAKGAGDAAKARARYAELADLWKDADADLPALAEVRAGGK